MTYVDTKDSKGKTKPQVVPQLNVDADLQKTKQALEARVPVCFHFTLSVFSCHIDELTYILHRMSPTGYQFGGGDCRFQIR